jgi:hypothetical protein
MQISAQLVQRLERYASVAFIYIVLNNTSTPPKPGVLRAENAFRYDNKFCDVSVLEVVQENREC